MYHYSVLIDLIKNIIGEPETGCEVGVCQGDLSQPLLEAFPKLNLLMIDHFKKYEHKTVPRLGKWTQDRMYQAMQMAVDRTMFASERRIIMVGDSTEASKIIQNESLDFVFIDAGHDYESVKLDLEHFCPKVKQNGLITGHDYRGKSKVSGYFGVKLAVNEYAKKHGYKIETFPYRVWRFI